MAVATAVPVRRAPEAPAERPARRSIPADEVPVPLAPARGIAIALGLGAVAWALIAALVFLR